MKNHWMQSYVNYVNWMLCHSYNEALLRKDACFKPFPVYMRKRGEQEAGVAAVQGSADASTCASADVTSDQTFSLSSERMCIYLPDIGSVAPPDGSAHLCVV